MSAETVRGTRSLRMAVAGGVVAALVGAGAVVGSAQSGEFPDRPQFATGASPVVAGQEIDVSGVGCAPEGPFQVDGPQVLVLFGRVDPAGNSLGFALMGEPPDQVEGLMTAAGVPGETSGSFTVDENGRWSGSLTMPDDIVEGHEYALKGLCLTRIAPDETSDDPNDVDYDTAYFEVGPFFLLEQPAPPDPTPPAPPSPPAPPVPATPTFTG